MICGRSIDSRPIATTRAGAEAVEEEPEIDLRERRTAQERPTRMPIVWTSLGREQFSERIGIVAIAVGFRKLAASRSPPRARPSASTSIVRLTPISARSCFSEAEPHGDRRKLHESGDESMNSRCCRRACACRAGPRRRGEPAADQNLQRAGILARADHIARTGALDDRAVDGRRRPGQWTQAEAARSRRPRFGDCADPSAQRMSAPTLGH